MSNNSIENEYSGQNKPFRFYHNERLWSLVDIVEQQRIQFPPIWALRDEFERSQQYQRVKETDLGMVRGYFWEYIVRSFLQAVQDFSQTGDILLDPIQKKHPEIDFEHGGKLYYTSDGLHYFRQANSGSLEAIEIITREGCPTTHEPSAEYDAILLIDGLPVIVEAKAVRPYDPKSKSSQHLKRGMRQDRSARIAKPIIDEFKTDVIGCLYITTKGALSDESSSQSRFRSQGGIFVELPYSYQELDVAVKQMNPYFLNNPTSVHNGN